MKTGTVEQSAQILTLKNEALKLVIRPDLGGRIDFLEDLKTGRHWLWHPTNYSADSSRSLPVGASFDDNWTGGWDEIFPNDAAGEFQGRNLVDHGELWSQVWQVVETTSHAIKLTYQCQTVPVAVEKIITLNATQPEAKIEYRFQNQSDATIPFLFKQHCAIAIEETDEILLPDCLVEPAFLEFSKIIGKAGKTPFPKAFAADGKEVDLQKMPPRSSKLQEFYYCTNLSSGMCGIRNSKTGSYLQMQFDTADFPYVWLFQSYGGWHNHYVVVLEPCTTVPFDLETATHNGTTAQLNPQEIQYRTLTLILGTLPSH